MTASETSTRISIEPRPDDTGDADAAALEGSGARPLAMGAQFGRYRIARLIGAGGMGAVYEATHLDLKKRVAIKILHPSYAGNDDVQKRFLREGEATSRIRHPHVVDVTDFGVHDGTPFLVMEYLHGESLAARLTRDGTLPVTELVDLMLPVCAALGAAHEAAVVHRDLKPENIFLARTHVGQVHPKVVDFGVSKLVEAAGEEGQPNLTLTSGLVGSPAYMSPEQVRSSKTLDARSDQYALGVVLYECATGRKPFRADNLYAMMGQIVEGRFAPPSAHRPDLSPAFESVVLRAMQREPAARFDDVHAMARALLPLASERARVVWAHAFESASGPRAAIVAATARHAAAHLAADSATVAARPSHEPATPAVALPARGEGGTLSESAREIDSPARRGGDARGPNRAAARGALLGVTALALVVGAAWRLSHQGGAPGVAGSLPAGVLRASAASAPAAPATYAVRMRVAPAGATLELDGAPAGSDALLRVLPRDGATHTVVVRAPGHASQTVMFRDAPPPEHVALTALPPAPAQAESPAAPAPTRPARAAASSSSRRARDVAPRATAAPGGATPPPSVGINGAAIVE